MNQKANTILKSLIEKRTQLEDPKDTKQGLEAATVAILIYNFEEIAGALWRLKRGEAVNFESNVNEIEKVLQDADTFLPGMKEVFQTKIKTIDLSNYQQVEHALNLIGWSSSNLVYALKKEDYGLNDLQSMN